jgi:competence protein ComGC
MIIEAVVLAVVSVGIFVILPNVINSGDGSHQARSRSRR